MHKPSPSSPNKRGLHLKDRGRGVSLRRFSNDKEFGFTPTNLFGKSDEDTSSSHGQGAGAGVSASTSNGSVSDANTSRLNGPSTAPSLSRPPLRRKRSKVAADSGEYLDSSIDEQANIRVGAKAALAGDDDLHDQYALQAMDTIEDSVLSLSASKSGALKPMSSERNLAEVKPLVPRRTFLPPLSAKDVEAVKKRGKRRSTEAEGKKEETPATTGELVKHSLSFVCFM